MERALQPAVVPPRFLEHVTQWAERQAAPVSVFLFGSRARGDHGPGSDWDFALVHEGEEPSLRGLPDTLESASIDWVPLDRAETLRDLNLCGVQNAVASSGLCLLGNPLPRPERSDVNIPMAWRFMGQAHEKMSECVQVLGNYWKRSPVLRRDAHASVSRNSADSAEYLCKVVLHLRSLKPDSIHRVDVLCDYLEENHPTDPLLPAPRECNKWTKKAHDSAYRTGPHETIEQSVTRLCHVAHLVDAVLTELCDKTPSHADYSLDLLQLEIDRGGFLKEADKLASTACPPETVQKIKGSADYWPSIADLKHRLNTPTLEEVQERQRRQAKRDEWAKGAPRGR